LFTIDYLNVSFVVDGVNVVVDASFDKMSDCKGIRENLMPRSKIVELYLHLPVCLHGIVLN
jgi:hypothetical protein